jgi:L-alanine-DL-glutamate epimerase-like enolase superfamily enzyme
MRRIEGVPLYWFEEPFPECEQNDRILHAYLDIERPGTMIADGESDPNIPQLMDLASKRLVDVLQPDVCGLGFTAWRKLIPSLSSVDTALRLMPGATW